jgi:hypothetical protein
MAPGCELKFDVSITRTRVAVFAAAERVLRNELKACQQNILIVVRLLFTTGT